MSDKHNIDIPSDVPKYQKKYTAKPPAKAKHKHVYEPCLLERPADWWRKKHEQCGETDLAFSSYCPVCGKVGPVDVERWWISKKCYSIGLEPYIKNEGTEEAKRELNPKTRTLPVFKVDDPFAKFVDIGEE